MIGRRGILRGLFAAPIAGPAAAKAAVDELAAAGIGGVVGNATLIAAEVDGPNPEKNGPARFTSFAQWLAGGGERNLRLQAAHVDALDPELVGMRLPLATKVRMQKARNYARLKRDRQSYIERVIGRRGMFEEWM